MPRRGAARFSGTTAANRVKMLVTTVLGVASGSGIMTIVTTADAATRRRSLPAAGNHDGSNPLDTVGRVESELRREHDTVNVV